METLLFFLGSFFVEGGLVLLLMRLITEPARAASRTPEDTSRQVERFLRERKAA